VSEQQAYNFEVILLQRVHLKRKFFFSAKTYTGEKMLMVNGDPGSRPLDPEVFYSPLNAQAQG
jgi:hypothetical protein